MIISTFHKLMLEITNQTPPVQSYASRKPSNSLHDKQLNLLEDALDVQRGFILYAGRVIKEQCEAWCVVTQSEVQGKVNYTYINDIESATTFLFYFDLSISDEQQEPLILGSSSSEKYIKLHTEECLAIERIQTLSKLSKNTQESA